MPERRPMEQSGDAFVYADVLRRDEFTCKN